MKPYVVLLTFAVAVAGCAAGEEGADVPAAAAEDPPAEDGTEEVEPGLEGELADDGGGEPVLYGETAVHSETVTPFDGGDPYDTAHEVTVTDVELLDEVDDGDEFDPWSVEPQGVYVAVTYTDVNAGTRPSAIVGASAELSTADGDRHADDFEASMILELDRGYDGGDINPGQTATRVLVFDVPVGADPAVLHMRDAFDAAATDFALS